VKAHGGTLEAESEGLGQGAKFTARFKIDESTSEKAVPANVPSAAKRPDLWLLRTEMGAPQEHLATMAAKAVPTNHATA
jgi:hypothetical protein